MRHSPILIRLGTLATALLTVGCATTDNGQDPYDLPQPNSASGVLERAIDAIGGRDKLTAAEDLQGQAVVTVYQPDGPRYPSLQQHRLDLPGGELNATGLLAGGRWEARVASAGGSRIEGDGFAIDADDARRIAEALATTLHRMRGAINLLGRAETLPAAERVTVAGKAYHRIRVKQQGRAYYFEPAGRLAMVTEGGDEPGQDGTVTLYDYTRLDNGLSVPKALRVMAIGRNVLVGESPRLTVEYLELAAE